MSVTSCMGSESRWRPIWEYRNNVNVINTESHLLALCVKQFNCLQYYIFHKKNTCSVSLSSVAITHMSKFKPGIFDNLHTRLGHIYFVVLYHFSKFLNIILRQNMFKTTVKYKYKRKTCFPSKR